METLGWLLVAAFFVGGLWYLCQFAVPDKQGDERRALRDEGEQ